MTLKRCACVSKASATEPVSGDSSGSPIALKYAFRTGDHYTSGRTAVRGSSWRQSATVRGNEPLAGVVAQVGPTGSVTCTVTLDGRVVDTKTRSGSWAVVYCGA